MNKEKYKLILEDWKEKLIPLGRNYFDTKNISLKTKSQKFLIETGLPILGFDYYIKFLPNTSILERVIKNERYYIVGDLNIYVPSFVLLGIREHDEKVFKIKNTEISSNVIFLNTNIESFSKFLIYICTFYNKYKSIKPQLINKSEFLKTFHELKSNLIEEDKVAMESNYWISIIASIEVDFADIFDTLPIENELSNNKKIKIDSEDLPF